MADKEFSVIVLHATSHALRAEKLLKKEGFAVRLIPVPRHISSDCGVCLRLLRKDVAVAKKILEEKNITIDGIYQI